MFYEYIIIYSVLFNNHFLVIVYLNEKKYNKSKTIPMIYTLRLLD